MDGVFMRKFEISLMIAVVVTLVWCAAGPHMAARWWTTAFEPLCDGVLSADAADGGMVLRSKLWELLTQYVF